MKQGGIKITIGTALAGVFLAGLSVTATSLPMGEEATVKVSAFARHIGNRIKYHYRIENETKQNVIAISIGRDNRDDDDPLNDILELSSRPSGWNVKFGLPSSSYNSPNGWRASMTTYDEEEETAIVDTEESMPYAITWKPLNERSRKLLAGRYSTRFSVTVDEPDVNFLTGHALIVFEEAKDGTTSIQSVPIKLIDLTPPSLEVSLIPNEIPYTDDGMPVAIKTTVKTSDDFDSMPRIKLEAISTENSSDDVKVLDASFGLDDRYFKLPTDPEAESDRTYVIYYSATDASWNQTLTSSTVTVFGAHKEDEMEIQAEYPGGMPQDSTPPARWPIVPPRIESAPLDITQ